MYKEEYWNRRPFPAYAAFHRLRNDKLDTSLALPSGLSLRVEVKSDRLSARSWWMSRATNTGFSCSGPRVVGISSPVFESPANNGKKSRLIRICSSGARYMSE